MKNSYKMGKWVVIKAIMGKNNCWKHEQLLRHFRATIKEGSLKE